MPFFEAFDFTWNLSDRIAFKSMEYFALFFTCVIVLFPQFFTWENLISPKAFTNLCSISWHVDPLFCETLSMIYVAWISAQGYEFKPFSHIVKVVVYCISASHKLFKRGFWSPGFVLWCHSVEITNFFLSVKFTWNQSWWIKRIKIWRVLPHFEALNLDFLWFFALFEHWNLPNLGNSEPQNGKKRQF